VTGEWFEESFGERYLRLYAHRDQVEAETAIETLFPGHSLAGRKVLDLACGAGRYLRVLHERGADVVGLDLSAVLLAEARRLGIAAPMVRGDMRHLPFRRGQFDLTVSMFTSFGYFNSLEAHAALAVEIARVTRAIIVLDLPDRDSLCEGLVPRSERRLEDRTVVERREVLDEPRRVVKTIEISEPGSDGLAERYEERVQLFSRDEIAALFEPAGFAIVDVMGDYDGSPWESGRSKRMMVRMQRRRHA
jgi:SAM-dependent methyltransferase